MKLNTWNKPTQFLNDVGFELEQSNILEAHRYIYLFFAPEDILNHQNNTNLWKSYSDKFSYSWI